MSLAYVSFCSGIEAATVAWHKLGWRPLAFSEIEAFPSRVLAHHYSDVPNHGDFTMFDWSIYRDKVDVMVGGTPCQAFSVAGLRGSLKDARGNLTLEFIRAADVIRPRYIVWENVPGVLSTSDNAFGCFLAGLVGSDEPLVAEQGWPSAGVVDGPSRSAAWRALDAQYTGLAQRRRRVFVVASIRGGPHPAEILFEWESLRRDTPPRREAGQGITHPIAGSLTSSGRGVSRGGDSRGGDSRGQDPLVPVIYNAEGSEGATLTSSNVGKHINNQTPVIVTHALRGEGHDASEDGTGRGTPIVPVIAGTLAGGSGARGYVNSPESTTFVPEVVGTYSCANCGAPYPALGTKDPTLHRVQLDGHMLLDNRCPQCGGGASSITYPQVVHGTQDPCVSDIAFALQQNNGAENAIVFDPTQVTSRENRSNPQPGDPCHTRAKGAQPPLIAFSAKDSGGDATSDLAPTLRSMSHAESHANGGGQMAIAYSIQAGALRENPDSGPDGVGVQEDQAYTLEARAEVQAVATLALRGRGGEQSVEVRTDGTANALLTPNGGRGGIGVGAIQAGMAVRRLTPRECERLQGFPDDYTAIPKAADGPRYKALGNSMAVPVMRWIGRRIQMADSTLEKK